MAPSANWVMKTDVLGLSVSFIFSSQLKISVDTSH